MQTYKPKNFIKRTEKTLKYQCSICNYIVDKPYLCRGMCGQTFCHQCMTCIKKNSNECPFRCSKPFELAELKEIELEFRCPFNPENCQESIPSLNKFYHHSEYCKFVPKNWKEKEQNFHKFRCDEGHDLFYMDCDVLRKIYGYDYYNKILNHICSSCGDKSISRSICPECSTKQNLIVLCANCRKPPCTKETCLYSHQLKKIDVSGRTSLICDFCGTAAYLLGPLGFRDQICNFDICESCFVNLPEKHELVPFKTQKSVISHLVKEPTHMFYSSDSDEEYFVYPAANNANANYNFSDSD